MPQPAAEREALDRAAGLAQRPQNQSNPRVGAVLRPDGLIQPRLA